MKYIRLEWPDSQIWFEDKDCFIGNDNDVFVPEDKFEDLPK